MSKVRTVFNTDDNNVSEIWTSLDFRVVNFFRRYAGIPDFLTAEDMDAMVSDNRIDPKMIFSYVQEVYRMCNEM